MAGVDPERGEGSHGSAAHRCRSRPASASPRYHRAHARAPAVRPDRARPVEVRLPIAIHWYGITYLVGFGLFLCLAARRARLPQFAARGWTRRDVEDLLFYGVLGVVIGGRLGYVLFYKPGYYAAHPLEIFAVWKGGMSFHGGLLGVIVAMALFARCAQAAVPRGDRPGRAVRADRPRRRAHRQLHQRRAVGPLRRPEPAVGDGLPAVGLAAAAPSVAALPVRARGRCCSSSLLWIYGKKPRGLGQVSGAFLVGYGVLRFIAEFFREPDSFLGLLALDMSMGQWLCVPMIVAGVALWLWGRGRAATPPPRRCAPRRPEPRCARSSSTPRPPA